MYTYKKRADFVTLRLRRQSQFSVRYSRVAYQTQCAWNCCLPDSTDRQPSGWLVRFFDVSSPTQHAKLLAEIKLLRGQQLESLAKATFGAWTAEEEAEHQERAARLARRVAELEALNTTKASWVDFANWFRAIPSTSCALHLPSAGFHQHRGRGPVD